MKRTHALSRGGPSATFIAALIVVAESARCEDIATMRSSASSSIVELSSSTA
jgi:hypothetical protein